jgi:hypothetical protein
MSISVPAGMRTSSVVVKVTAPDAVVPSWRKMPWSSSQMTSNTAKGTEAATEAASSAITLIASRITTSRSPGFPSQPGHAAWIRAIAAFDIATRSTVIGTSMNRSLMLQPPR